MKIMIISSICFYPEYFRTFLSNVEWAFANHKIKIYILSYKEYRELLSHNSVVPIELILFDKKNSFFPFYNEVHNIIKEKEDYDGYVFLQQDVILTEVFEKNFFDNYDVCNFLNRPYLGVYKDQKIYFKRVWEAFLFVSKEIIKKCIENKIEFGNKKKQLINFDIKEGDLYVNHNENFLKIKDFISSNNLDTMFEFSIWCFLNKIKVKDFSLDEEAEFGKGTVHFNGFEKIPGYELIRKKNFEFNLDFYSYESKMYLNHLFLKSLFTDVEWPKKANKNLIRYLQNKIYKINLDFIGGKLPPIKLLRKIF